MSIKNEHIIHYVKEDRYICNGAVSTTPSKSSTNKEEITCKNCKVKLQKPEAKPEDIEKLTGNIARLVKLLNQANTKYREEKRKNQIITKKLIRFKKQIDLLIQHPWSKSHTSNNRKK